MGQLQDRMIEDLTLRGSAPATTSAYVRYARAFVAFHRRSPAELGEEHVRAWLLHRNRPEVGVRRVGRARGTYAHGGSPCRAFTSQLSQPS